MTQFRSMFYPKDDHSKWQDVIHASLHPIALTGAGISVASGLPTMKMTWRGIRLPEVFSIKTFEAYPTEFYRSYRELLDWRHASPNRAHQAITALQMPVITQNIDGLHQKSGNQHVLELHGNLHQLVCLRCNERFASELALRCSLPTCPTCQLLLKPDIVLEGEEVRHFAIAVDWIGNADLLLIVGTRLRMEPCNQLPMIAKRKGIPIIQLNELAEKVLPVLIGFPAK